MATDPVCGMYVEEQTSSLSVEQEGRKYYFCSATCKLQFERPAREMNNLKISLLVSWPLSIAIALMTYLFHFTYYGYAMLALATVVQFYPGWRFYAGLIDAFKNRSANMDTLIAVGTTAAWIYSAVVVVFPYVFPSTGVYFDTSTLIIALVLTGTYMQRLSESRASSAVSALIALQPKTAHVFKGGKILDVQVDELKTGDTLLVKPGEAIPTDSIIVRGNSSIDESMITGESMPISRRKGDSVTGGTINMDGSLVIKAAKVGEDTALSQIVNIVRDAASSKVPIQRLADRISSYFVPTVVLVGIAAALLWYAFGVGSGIAMLIFVSVLIIACPCALGIATPAALLVSSGKAAKEGILIKSGEALQAASKANVIVLDKTGTLTKGRPEVTDIIPLRGSSRNGVLREAAIAESNSEHVLARAVIDSARKHRMKITFPSEFSYRKGSGVTAVHSGRSISVGNRDLFPRMQTKGIESSLERLELQGKTVLIVGRNRRITGMIAVADQIKDDSKKAVKSLISMGIDPWMVTGDNERTAMHVAKQLGIKNVVAGAKPKDKLVKIEELQKSGKIVAMVGDGVNDAPALTKADIGIAIGAGTEVAMQAGSIILVRNKISDVPVALSLGRDTMRKIKQNLFWAFGYNSILIPIAGGALIPFFTVSIYSFLPMLAAVAMAISSLTVVSNSLLLARHPSGRG